MAQQKQAKNMEAAAGAAFDEGFLPLILKEKKEELEADGWTFDYDAEKDQWTGTKPGAVGGANFNSLDKLIGYIERRIDEDKRRAETDAHNYLDPPVESDTDENGYMQSVDGFSARNESALPVFAFESVRVKLTETEQRDRDASLRNSLNLRDAEISRFAAEKEIQLK